MRKITMIVKETGHPDVPPWWADIYIDGLHTGCGPIDVCQKSVAELQGSADKTDFVYNFWINEGEVKP